LLRLPDSYQEGIVQARMAGMIVTVLEERPVVVRMEAFF
jgi:hypothetical protein